MTDRIFSLLSLCRKAGKVSSGEFAVEEDLKRRRAKLVILSEEASENTKKKFRNMCDYRKVPCILYGGKEQLGHCIGCGERAVACVTDEGFAGKLLQLHEQLH